MSWEWILYDDYHPEDGGYWKFNYPNGVSVCVEDGDPDEPPSNLLPENQTVAIYFPPMDEWEMGVGVQPNVALLLAEKFDNLIKEFKTHKK